MTETSYNRHLSSLAAIFLLGDAIIVLPYTAGKYSILGLAVSAIFSILLFFAVTPIVNLLLFKKSNNILFKLIAVLFWIATSFYAFYNAAITFIRYMRFVDKILLPNTQRFFISLIFILPVIILFLKKKEVILKFSLIALFAAVFIILLFFFLSSKDFEIKNIYIYSLPTLKELCNNSIPYFLNLSLPTLLIPLYSTIFISKPKTSSAFTGLIIGLLSVSICITESLLLFGAPLTSRLEFPLASAVSTVTVGPLFSRMDGVIYCLFFITALIKTSICLKLSYLSIKKIKEI